MAEQIKIAELTINAGKLVTELKTTKTEIDRLKNAQKELKDAGKENTSAFIKNEAALKTANTTYRTQQKTLQQVTGATKELSNEMQREVKSLADAELNNKKLRQARANLNLTTDEGKKALKGINEKIDQNTDFMKENQDEQVQNKMNVGNYKDSILEATGAQQAYTQGTKLMAVAQGVTNVVVGKSTGAMKLFRIALAGTGIGLLVLALGSLISYLTSTQEGIDKVSSVLVPLKTVFDSVLGVIQKLGKSLFDAFSNPKKLISDIGTAIKENLINRFTALSKIIESAMNMDWKGVADGVLQAGTGVENLTGKIKGAGDATSKFFGDAITQGKEIDRITKELRKSEGDYMLKKEELNKVFEQQKKLAEDVNLSTSEREAAVEKAMKAQEEIRKITENRLKQEYRLLELKTLQNDTSDEEKNELKRKMAEIEKAIAEEAAKTTELQNKKNSIIKDGATKAMAARQKVLDDAIAKQQEELDHYIASQGTKAKTLKEEVEIAKEVAKQKQEVLDAQLEAGKISQMAYDTEKLNIANDLAQKQTELAVDNAQREVQAYKDANASRLTDGQELTQELLNQEQKRLDDIAQKERDYHKERLEQGVINEQEYNDAINQVNLDNKASKDAVQATYDEQEKQKKLDSIEWDKEMELLQASDKFERQQIQLDRSYQTQLAEAQRLGKDTTAIDAAYAEQSKQIEADKVNSKMTMAAAALNNMITIFGKESAAGKAAATAMSLINTYQGITKALASAPPPYNFISAAAVGAAGFSAVKDINTTKQPPLPAKSTPKRFALGGIFSGPSHAQGGIPTPFGEVEGGEAVINKRSTAMFGGLLSQINEAGGGKKFADGGKFGSAGVSKSMTLIDYDLLATKVGQANMNLPAPRVAVDEIQSTQTRVQAIETRANF